MSSRLLQIVERIRSSYWFWPVIMSLAAIALALSAEQIDRNLDFEILRETQWFYSGDPAGARAILSTIASSMITVAGVVFSITMVALVLASSQFGPRLLSGFMRDRVHQLVLGTFVSTFLYCVVLLRSIEEHDDGRFVPHLAVSVGVLFAVASVGVLIYFIHHVATNIQAPNVVSSVGDDLDRAIRRSFPDPGDPLPAEETVGNAILDEEAGEALVTVTAGRSGYLQYIDYDRLSSLAAERGFVIRCVCRVGDHLLPQSQIADILARRGTTGPDEDDRGEEGARPPGDMLADEIREALVLGTWRSDANDPAAVAGKLTELAVRALSPGINDPVTAANCVDRLASALSEIARRPPAAETRRDEDGELTLVYRAPDLVSLLDPALHPIREHARGEASVLARLATRLNALEAVTRRPADIEAIRDHLRLVAEAGRSLESPWGRALVEDALGRPGPAPEGVRPTVTPELFP